MSVEVCPSSSAARATSTPFSRASLTNDWRYVYDTTPLGSGSFARSVACFGHISMRAQAEVLSARRSDTPPSAVASGFIVVGQVERCYAFFAGERLSPSGRERVLFDEIE